MADKTANLHDLELAITARAQKDTRFREQLLADPKAAIAAATGVALPEGTQVKLLQREPDTLYVILPEAREPGELSEAELGAVTGGTGATTGTVKDIDTGQKRAIDL